MQIRFDKVLDTLILFIPYKNRRFIRKLSEKLKYQYKHKEFESRKKEILEHLKQKVKNGEKINVAFLIYHESKWKNQSIYDLLEENDNFIPYIFITRIDVPQKSPDYQTPEEVKNTYNFFKNKNMRTCLAYDFQLNNWISLDEINPKPDIVYYCEPWAINLSQSPVTVSNYAYTCYSPYFVPTSKSHIEYDLPLHKTVHTHYVQDELVKNFYSKNMQNKGINLKTAGHPILDYFYLNREKTFENKNTIIYAPHHSVDLNSTLRWGTFLEMGDFILNWAKNHPEFNYIFKPHPSLKGYLIKNNLKTKEYVENYWQEWSKIGLTYESGDYLDMFMESIAMITDCGSFKTEYFMTQKPQIYLKSKYSQAFNDTVEKICNTCYIAQNNEELNSILEEVLINKNDYKKEERLKLYKELGFENNYTAKNIVDDFEKMLGIE